jgi:tyrosyl-tRNA synthetase
MNIWEELRWRGLVQDISDEELLQRLGPGTSFYFGIDPTAPSPHAGNLIGLLLCLRLGKAGLKPILLFGGATAAIGDPSGRNSERQLMARETIVANISNQKRLVQAIYERAGVAATFVDNYDWTAGITALEFLRDIGKHFTVNFMLAKEVVKTRLDGDGISFTEFSYMLLQAFDFYHLHQSHACALQVGGSDQWGNMTAGLELIRRKTTGGQACVLSYPLMTDAQGRKIGKSTGGALWLDPSMTSPYRFHQYWLNVGDADVLKLIKLFTLADQATLDELSSSMQQSPEKRIPQQYLADTVCSLVHGEQATQSAKQCAQVLFGGAALDSLSIPELLDIFSEVPSTSLARGQFEQLPLLDLVVQTGLLKSKGEAKRLLENGGLYVNNVRPKDASAGLSECLLGGELLVLRSGKKQYHLVRVLG